MKIHCLGLRSFVSPFSATVSLRSSVHPLIHSPPTGFDMVDTPSQLAKLWTREGYSVKVLCKDRFSGGGNPETGNPAFQFRCASTRWTGGKGRGGRFSTNTRCIPWHETPQKRDLQQSDIIFIRESKNINKNVDTKNQNPTTWSFNKPWKYIPPLWTKPAFVSPFTSQTASWYLQEC